MTATILLGHEVGWNPPRSNLSMFWLKLAHGAVIVGLAIVALPSALLESPIAREALIGLGAMSLDMPLTEQLRRAMDDGGDAVLDHGGPLLSIREQILVKLDAWSVLRRCAEVLPAQFPACQFEIARDAAGPGAAHPVVVTPGVQLFSLSIALLPFVHLAGLGVGLASLISRARSAVAAELNFRMIETAVTLIMLACAVVYYDWLASVGARLVAAISSANPAPPADVAARIAQEPGITAHFEIFLLFGVLAMLANGCAICVLRRRLAR